MSTIDREELLTSPATRRRVLKTGAKVAYAAPIVAASFKLSSINASAQDLSDVIGRTCSGDFVCGQTAAPPCGSNEFGTCFCFKGATLPPGVGFCGSNEACSELQGCDPTNPVCPANQLCSVDTCCGVPVCIETCAQSDTFGIGALSGDGPAG